MTTETETKKFSFKKLAITLTGIAIVLGLVSYFNLGQAGNFSSSSYEQQIVNIGVKLTYQAINDKKLNSYSDLHVWLVDNTLDKSKLLKLKEEIELKQNRLKIEKHVVDGLLE